MINIPTDSIKKISTQDKLYNVALEPNGVLTRLLSHFVAQSSKIGLIPFKNDTWNNQSVKEAYNKAAKQTKVIDTSCMDEIL